MSALAAPVRRELERIDRIRAEPSERSGHPLLTRRWTRLRPHPVQRAYWEAPHRFNTLPCGRRSGKTELAKRKLVLRALMGTRFPTPRFFAAAPTRDQAKRIYWADLKMLVPAWAKRGRPRETELVIELVNGAELHVVGLDKPERIEGSPWDGGVLDEYANMRPTAWTQNVRPALSDRGGWCDFIGVPEGRNHYYDLDRSAKAKLAEHGAASAWGSFHWRSEDILSPEEIEAAKDDLDELTYEQEYGGSFVTFEGRVYYVFSEPTHCERLWGRYDPDADLILAFDFNVSPGVAAIGQEMTLPNGQRGTGWIGEVWIPRASNTPRVCRKILQDWGAHRGRVSCYGDATGGAEGTAKVEGSDWDLIRAILKGGDREAGLDGFGERLRLRVKTKNPAERARVNAVNSRLKSASGTVRMMVDPARCPHLVKDFEGVKTVEGSAGEIDKKSDPMLTHLTDAVGYYVEYEFPVRKRRAETTEFKV
ncbi:MAG: terminase large subunit domain-containing protein [Gemmatimonadota bacterium]